MERYTYGYNWNAEMREATYAHVDDAPRFHRFRGSLEIYTTYTPRPRADKPWLPCPPTEGGRSPRSPQGASSFLLLRAC